MEKSRHWDIYVLFATCGLWLGVGRRTQTMLRSEARAVAGDVGASLGAIVLAARDEAKSVRRIDRLKHSWLFLHTLDSVAAVEKLVAFYVEQHNTVMLHSQFNGRTPDEVYAGAASDLEDQLAERRCQARAERIATNRTLTCEDSAPQKALARKCSVIRPGCN